MMNRNILRAVALLLLSASLVLTGCSKNTIIIEPGAGGNTGNGSESSLITFHASVESRNMTRSMSPIQKNIRVQMLAFPGTAADASGIPLAAGPYLTPNPGILSGLNGYQMQLPVGKYNFYGVSNNDSYPAPTFTAGVSEPLYNGIDYLWWNGLQMDVTTSQTGIPVVFLHAATQVVFEVVAGNGVEINELVLAHISVPQPGSQMNLTAGIIEPATAFQSGIGDKMGINGMVAQYTMLPIKADTSMTVSFDVRVNGETSARTYDVQVPLPGGELKSGDSYLFKAVIEGETVSFASVNVTDWVDVDETGKPLYPVQK